MAITQGDTNGIGYELIFKIFNEPEMLELCTPIIYGSPKVASYHRKALNMDANFSIINRASDAKDGRVNLLTTFDEEVKVELGTPDKEGGHAALMALDRAITDYRDNLFDVLVLAPLNKDVVQDEGFEFKGQDKYIEECFDEGSTAMLILQNEDLRIGLSTDETALKNVASKITKTNLTHKITTLLNSMRRDYRISNPRIAVLSLNATEGKEEEEVIKPVINELTEKSMNVFGPYKSETFFAQHYYDHFDAVLAMYHDQGVTPFMALSPSMGVEMITGLPLVCTAPYQGVSYEIAGKGVADESGMRNAIYLAIDTYRNRISYDEPMDNPLPKLYHEKKDESEKVRFSIPKKHETETQDNKQ